MYKVFFFLLISVFFEYIIITLTKKSNTPETNYIHALGIMSSCKHALRYILLFIIMNDNNVFIPWVLILKDL